MAEHSCRMRILAKQKAFFKGVRTYILQPVMDDSDSIGEKATGILNALDLPRETHLHLLRTIRLYMDVTDGDAKYAMLTVGCTDCINVKYWKLVCEKWEVSLSDLEEGGWHKIRRLVEAWSNQHFSFDDSNETAAGVLTWLHERYTLPKEAFEYESHHATYHGVIKRSEGLLRWLKINYAEFDVNKAYEYAEFLYGKDPQKLAEEKAKIRAKIKEFGTLFVRIGREWIQFTS